MLNFGIYLVFLATSNALLFPQSERTRTSSAIGHGPEPCEPLYERPRYDERYSSKYVDNNRKSSDRFDDDNGMSEEGVLRNLVLKETLANAAKRRYLETLSKDQGVVAIRHGDKGNAEIRESSRPSRRTLGGEGLRFVRIEAIPETGGVAGLSARYPIKTMYPRRIIVDDSKPRPNRLRNRKLKRIVKTVLRTEENNDGDTSEFDDDLSEPMIYYPEDDFRTHKPNQNTNTNFNDIGGTNDRPGFRISPKIILPSRSKYEPPPYYGESRMMDYEDDNSVKPDNDSADVSAVEIENKTSDEDLHEVVQEDGKNEKTFETDSLQVENSEATTRDSSPAEDIEQVTSSSTHEPIEIVTTVTPGITVTETVPEDTEDSEKKFKKIHKPKSYERLHRRKSKRRRVSKKSHHETKIHAEQQQDDVPTTTKIIESTTENLAKPEDEIKDGESKDEETVTKENGPKTLDDDKNSEIGNVSESPEKEKTDSETSDKLEPQVPEDSTEIASVEEPNELSVVDSVVEAKPSSEANSDGSPNGSNNKVTIEEEVTPSRDGEDLHEKKHDRKHRTDEENDKLEREKIARGNDLGSIAKSSSPDKDQELSFDQISDDRVNNHRLKSSNSRQLKSGQKRSKLHSIEDLETIDDLQDIVDNSLQIDENKENKFRSRNHVQNLNSSKELRHLKQKMNSESEVQPKSNPKKKKGPSRIGEHVKIPQVLDPVDSQTYRRSSLRKKSRRNENRNVNTNVNKNTIRNSGLPKLAHIDDFDEDDERLLEIIANRRNLNRNSNINQNHIEIEANRHDSREDSNGRVYKIISSRRALERYINDDIESNGNKNFNKNINKNVNVNRNENRFSEGMF